MNDGEDIKMRDLPMLDVDRERMRNEFDNFDELTLTEFKAAAAQRVDELLDLITMLKEES